MDSKHAVEVFKIAMTEPGRVVSVTVRYPTYRPRGFVLEVDHYEQRDGMVVRTLRVGGPDGSREVQLVDAKRFNARTLAKLADAVRTLGTRERDLAEREYRAFMASSGWKAQASPFGDA